MKCPDFDEEDFMLLEKRGAVYDSRLFSATVELADPAKNKYSMFVIYHGVLAQVFEPQVAV